VLAPTVLYKVNRNVILVSPGVPIFVYT